MKKEMMPEFRMKALCNDEATGEFFFRLAFRNVDGMFTTIHIARSDIDQRKTLKQTLKNAGAFFHQEDELNDDAMDRLICSQSTARRITFAKATGWRDDGKLFVTPGEVISCSDEPSRIRPPRDEAQHLRCAHKGSLSGWKERVAAPARSSSRLAFAICLGLAAPLLRLAGLHSFGVHVAALSKSGKSTMQVAGGSVIGLRNEDNLPSFDISDAGFSELLARSNDLLVPLNEEGLMAGSPSECNVRLRRMAYVIAQSGGTTYSTHAKIPKYGESSERRNIVLASGEDSLDKIAQKVGQAREPGAMIRFIDLPGTSRGATDIFDLAPVMPNSERLRWGRDTCMKIRKGAEAHHGVALCALVKKVIQRRATVEKRLRQLRDNFVDKIVTDQDDQIVRHMALLFGHVYAAGVLGVRFNILPWPEEFVTKAFKRCWNGARRSLRLESELLRAAIKTLKQKASSGTIIQASLIKHGPRRYKNADGYYRRQNAERQLVVRGERFKSWFSDPRQPGLLLRWLGGRGALANSGRGQQQSGPSIVWAESQVEWPDRSRPRSIVILLDKLEQ